jgi:serine/threonine-protein kinase RsbW
MRTTLSMFLPLSEKNIRQAGLTEHSFGSDRSTLILQSDFNGINTFYHYLDSLEKRWKIPPPLRENIRICLSEAVQNAVNHGNLSEVRKAVTITAERYEGTFLFSIRDEGIGFDFDDLPDPTAQANLDKPYGRGVFLMKQLSDHLEFSEGGRKVHLEFRLKTD